MQDSCAGHKFTEVSLLAILWRCDDCRSLTCYTDACMENHCCCGEEKTGCVQNSWHVLSDEYLICNRTLDLHSWRVNGILPQGI